jgi:hypothetical protein
LRATRPAMPTDRTQALRLTREKAAAFNKCKDSPQRHSMRKGAKPPRPQAHLHQPREPLDVGARLRATRPAMPADRTQALRLTREKAAAFNKCKDSPQRHSMRKGAKPPRPQAHLHQPREPLGVGARLRATRPAMPTDRTQALRLTREKAAAFNKCKDSPQRHSMRKGAKPPRPQAHLHQPREPLDVGARLRATRPAMPTDRTQALRLTREKAAAFNKCKDSPQRHSMRKGAKPPRPQAHLHQPREPLDVGARLRATRPAMPTDRTQALRLTREKAAAFNKCKDSPQRHSMRKGAKPPRPQAHLHQPREPLDVGARLRATRPAMPADRTQALRLTREKAAAFNKCKDSPQRHSMRKGAKPPRPQAHLHQPREPLGVGARLRATRPAMPADRTQALRLTREKAAAFNKCKDSPQRHSMRKGAKPPRPQAQGAKPPRPQAHLHQPREPLDVGARLRATRPAMPADRTQALRLTREKAAAFN